MRRYHVDTGKVEDICVLEDPDAIPDGLKPATNGDLYIGTVLTGGVSVVGADGTDKGLLKGFGDYVSNVQFRGSTLYVTDIGGGTGDDSGVPRLDLARRARRRHGARALPREDRLVERPLGRGSGDRSGSSSRSGSGRRRPAPSMSQRTEGMVTEFEEGSSIIDGLVSGEMSRDQFIRRATLLGISATAIGGMLAATGKATAADLGAARSLAGSTVNLLVAAEGDEKGVRDKIGEMKKRFGIDVKMTALAVGPLIEKSNQSFKAPTGTYDAVMVLGFTVAQMVGGGNFDAAQRLRGEEGPGRMGLRATSPRASSTTSATSTPPTVASAARPST